MPTGPQRNEGRQAKREVSCPPYAQAGPILMEKKPSPLKTMESAANQTTLPYPNQKLAASSAPA